MMELAKMAKIKKPVSTNYKTVIKKSFKKFLKVLFFYDSSYPKDTRKS